MTKKYITILIFSIVVILLTVLCIGIFADDNAGESLLLKKDVNINEPLTIDIDKGNYSIIFWDKDYVEVWGTDFYNYIKDKNESECKVTDMEQKIKITNFNYDNVITYQLFSWLPLLQFEKYRDGQIGSSNNHYVQFIFYVPNGMGVIEAN